MLRDVLPSSRLRIPAEPSSGTRTEPYGSAMTKRTRKARTEAPTTLSLSIKNFAHLANVHLNLGDLTVLVGPQGAGKSLALQWLKIAMDGRQLVEALAAAGHTIDRADVLIGLIFGTGMAPAWGSKTEVMLGGRRIAPKMLRRVGNDEEKLFFVPAHRSMLISDGWAAPFQKLTSDTPAVARV